MAHSTISQIKTAIEKPCLQCGKLFQTFVYRIKVGGGKFCSIICAHHYRAAHPKSSPEERFWEKVNKTESCWLYTGSTNHKGYGSFYVDKTRGKIPAHRFAWELASGPIPEGLFVCHNCPGGDNPRCVRRSHLFLGTPQDNSTDMVNKGRHFRGESAPAVILTSEQVLEIRNLYAQGGISHRGLGKMFGVHEGTIRSLILRVSWKHI